MGVCFGVKFCVKKVFLGSYTATVGYRLYVCCVAGTGMIPQS